MMSIILIIIQANDFPAALPRVRWIDILRSHREVGPARPKYNEVIKALETRLSVAPCRKGTMIPRRNDFGQQLILQTICKKDTVVP